MEPEIEWRDVEGSLERSENSSRKADGPSLKVGDSDGREQGVNSEGPSRSALPLNAIFCAP